jgi:hypothetical protein
MTPIMMLLAYILPLPIMAACFYYHIFAGMEDIVSRLIAIAVVSLAPSAVLMLLVFKRVVHFLFYVICISAVMFGLHHFGLIGQTGKP